MKVSICFATHNKQNELRNVLFSIKRQRFDPKKISLSLNIVDDNSDIDPWPLINEFFNIKEVNYKRLGKHNKGFIHPYTHLWNMSDAEALIIISSDVIFVHDYTVAELCNYVRPNTPVFAEILNTDVDPELYKKDFDLEMLPFLKDWEEKAKNHKNIHVGRRKHESWLFFLGIILKRDLLSKTLAKDIYCDAVIDQLMKKNNMEAKLLTHIKGIHQKHPTGLHECPIENYCKFYCARTKAKRNIQFPEYYHKSMKVVSNFK